jgi:hypothetical protein
MLELTITPPCAHSRVDSQHIYHGPLYVSVDLNPMPESTLTLWHSRLYPPVWDFGFRLSVRYSLPGKDERGAQDESKYVGDGPLQGQDEQVVGLEETQVPAHK